MRGHCKNHPQVSAKRRCFQCQGFICVDCQILAERHYFCSLACYKQFQQPSVSALPKQPSPAVAEAATVKAAKPQRRLRRFVDRTLLVQISLFALMVFLLWLHIDSRSQLESLRKQMAAQARAHNGNGIAKNAKSQLTLLKPAKGSMVMSNVIDIAGEAEDNQIITLGVDDEIRAVTLPHGGRFQFNDVRVSRRQNEFTIRAISENGDVTALETLRFDFHSPSLNFLAKDLTRGDLAQRNVALTFDGGYLANACEEILDVLKTKDAKSTMFLTGTFIRKYPDVVQRMLADGHEIGNHTNHHPHLTDFTSNQAHVTRAEVTRDFLHKELNDAAHDFSKLTGKKFTPLWRAPYGEHNLEIRQWAAELGYRHIGWTLGHDQEGNMDTMDWVADTTSPAYLTADEILEKVLNFGNGSEAAANGAIVIMHLGTQRSGDFPHQKLADIIDGLRERGYQLVRVSEMIN
jgi:peptidoglycan/xylan/chitin deacetylase (PgdA/CDA1 family)